ncbi:hypothetical protein Athai_63640 [Actinocatenispora thailandica]|uniref:Tyr recombinase domain-containing protein n=1 Tax=Actinocatenispora thailandica TaxID=227318 RepID=A0A7R7DWB4_9ACTN|nr:hypothetical protein Athai_63640 [Actinocatenispora thailandica]
MLWVRQAVQRADGKLSFVPVKTHRSVRPVPIPAFGVRALEKHRAVQAAEKLAAGEAWKDNGLVFASSIGTPLEPRNVNRVFETVRAEADLPWLHLHDLRHAFATFLLTGGVELRTVMELLGHSTIRLTADTYGHVLPATARGASGVMDGLLRRDNG